MRVILIACILLLTDFAFAAKSSSCSMSAEAWAVIQSLPATPNLKKARSILIRETKKNPRCALQWYNLGNVFYLMGSYDLAEKAYRRGLQYESSIAPLMKFHLAKAQFRKNKLIDAVLTYSEVPPRRLPPPMRQELKRELNYVYAKNLHEALQDLKSENYESAENRLIANLSIRQNAYLYSTLAVALHQQNKWDRERASLRYGSEVLQSEEEDLIINRIERALLRKTLPSTQWHMIADLASGYEENIRRVADTSLYRNSGFVKSVVDLERFLLNSGDVRSFLGFGLTDYRYFDVPSEDYSTLYLTQRNVLPNIDWNYELSPQISYELYGGEPYWLRPGIRGEVNRGWDESSLGVALSYQRNLDRSEGLDYIDGSSTALNLYYTHNLTEQFFVSISYAFFNYESGDDVTEFYRVPLAYESQAPTVKLSYRLRDGWTLKTSYEYQQKKYKRLVLPDNISRDDQVSTFTLQTNIDLKDNMVLYIKGLWQTSNSTMGPESPLDANWKSQTYYAGVGWSVF